MDKLRTPAPSPVAGVFVLSPRLPRNGLFLRAICRILTLSALLILLTFNAPANAEVGVSIQGAVCDTSGAPLSDVHVRLLEYAAWTVTDPSGRFVFRGVPPGRYTLEASRLGYAAAALKALEIREGIAVRADLTLMPQPVILPEAQVRLGSAGYIERGGDQLVLTRRDWANSGARDLAAVMRDLPGVMVLEGSGVQRLSLRGSPPRVVSVNLDGIPLNDPGTGEADLSVIPLSEVESIRIDFAGLGGAVSLSSKKLETNIPANRISASGAAGSFGGWTGGGRWESSAPLRGAAASYSHREEPGSFPYWLDDGRVRRRVNNYDRADNLSLKATGDMKGSILDASVFLIDAERGVPGLIYSAPTPEATLTDRRALASFRLSRSFGRSYGTALAHVSSSGARFISPAQQYNPETGQFIRPTPEDNRYTAFGGGLRLSLMMIHPVPDFPLLQEWSVEEASQADAYRGEDLLRGATTVGSIGKGQARRDVHRLALQIRCGGGKERGWNYRITPRLAMAVVLNQGARDYEFFSPDAAVSGGWTGPRASLSVHAGWGRSLSAPPFNAQFLIENASAVGNPDLRPERGEGLRVGGDLSMNPAGIQLEGGVTWFERDARDLIVWKRSSAGRYYPANLTRVHSRGWECRGMLKAFDARLNLGMDYRYEDSRLDLPGDVNDGHIPPLSARHSGSGRAGFNHPLASVLLQTRWAGRRYSTESNLDNLSTAGMGLDPYVVWDVSLQRNFKWRRWEFNLSGGVDNLFDRCYRLVERSPLPGRVWRLETMISVEVPSLIPRQRGAGCPHPAPVKLSDAGCQHPAVETSCKLDMCRLISQTPYPADKAMADNATLKF